MIRLLAGVDVGTSGVKVGIFDLEGQIVGLGRSSHRVESPHPAWAQVDPELWWHGFLSALEQACASGGVKAGEIGALGISVLFPTVVPLDAQGRALHPAILYSDQRSLEQVRAIEAAVPREQYEALIGNRLVPGTCAVTSMAWLRDWSDRCHAASVTYERSDLKKPESERSDRRTLRVFGSANTFIIARLTGAPEACQPRFWTDPTHVALSGLADIRDPWRWSDALCQQLGIAQRHLPEIAGPAQVVGPIAEPAARATGLRAGTPVVAGSGDVVASAVGAGARLGGPVVYIAGSTDCVAVPMARPTADAAWVNCAYIDPGTWLGVGATTSSGVSVDWFAGEFLPETRFFGKKRVSDQALDMMTGLAASSPPGSNRLLYLPYLQGERTPVWDPLARGVLIGFTPSTTRGDLARAVFEGTAFALRQVIERAGSAMQGPGPGIRAVGGGTRNALWNQIKADVLQIPLHVLAFQETSALGAALLAGVGCGAYRSFAEATEVAERMARAEVVEPNPRWAGLYDQLFDLYARVYPQTKEIVHQLSQGAGSRE